MVLLFLTVFAALLGLAFGSFLNVCLSRWPADESIVAPRSHCEACGRTLVWWENLPVASFVFLGGRCRTCRAAISVRHLIVEVAVSLLWAVSVWQSVHLFVLSGAALPVAVLASITRLVLLWLLVALAVLDFEHLWLPDFLTLTGAALGLIVFAALDYFLSPGTWLRDVAFRLLAACSAALLILFIRWSYRLLRGQQGMGMGDVKLMAMLGAWLGFFGSLISFALGVLVGAAFAIFLLAVPSARRGAETWLTAKMPFGTFLCLGGIVAALWGDRIVAAYLRMIGM